MIKHGQYGTPLYKKWMAMKRRCLNKNEKCYKRYGGAGVTVCKDWLDFKGFYKDMAKSFKKGLSIERIDNTKGYSKENCRWIPMSKQSRNRKGVRLYKYKGQSLTAGEWERKLGFKEGTIYRRIEFYKWSIRKALTTPRFGKTA